MLNRFVIFFAVLFAGFSAEAQKTVELLNSEVIKYGKKNGETFNRLIGNVILKQNQTTIYCDSAHLFEARNAVNAFGRVRITDGDSVTITSRGLNYDGNTRIAQLRRNVVFTKLGTATLYTDYLDYSRPSELAYYYNGGRLVDSINVLTSEKGYYNLTSNLASFKKDVVVTNPDYKMFSDSLQYHSTTKIIYFVDSTKVVNKDSSTFIYESGEYNTILKTSVLRRGTGETPQYTIVGNSYNLDGVKNIARVRGNVIMTHKEENLLIYGQASDYYKEAGISKVYNNAYVAKVTDDNDTIFISADTLVSLDNVDPAKRKLLAYKNVKIFKTDMQGIADSLEYRSADSTVYFYRKPILWNGGNQMTADSIHMLIQNNTISKIFLNGNSFVISRDSVENFNQIKGRKMIAEVTKGKISKVFVNGNGETLYFVLDDKTQAMVGMNKSISSLILICFREGQVDNLSFYVKPDAKLIPPHELTKEDRLLTGFKWQAELKPTKKDVAKEQLQNSRGKEQKMMKK